MKTIRKGISNQNLQKAVECGNFSSGWCCVKGKHKGKHKGNTGHCCNKGNNGYCCTK